MGRNFAARPILKICFVSLPKKVVLPRHPGTLLDLIKDIKLVLKRARQAIKPPDVDDDSLMQLVEPLL